MGSNGNQLTGSVLVVGAGISGIQAALDLAEIGYKVYLVEKSPAIGGTMPMLDKTFPTNDCSMCILSPKLVECGRHRNIEVLTLSEVTGISGSPGNFKVKILRHPRYVDPEKCLGCGACANECPVDVPDAFNQNLGERKAIYKLYAQAYPNAYVIDKENCIECMACVDACPADAINHEMEEEELEVEVGSVIVCPGFELFQPELRGEYGYGIYANVLTSLQFERMLSASGPFKGHLTRPSDGQTPKRVAFIQCVGSRDIARCRGYCSAVCCMYATKEAIIAKEHEPDLDVTIFYMDVRAYGKDFEKYYNRARENYGVRYIRSIPSSIYELQKTKNLRVRYRDGNGSQMEEDFDLVVLSLGLRPSQAAIELAQRLGLELDEYSFCRPASLTGVATSKPGIYVAGPFSGPKDIPETVMQASAAAGDAAAFLAPARNTLVSERVFPPERDVSGEEPRIGVFVCHCGINIGSVVDVPRVVAEAAKLPYVVHAQEGLYVCAQDSQAAMREIIASKGLNRVVVASCSPRTHKPLFQETMREAGLNPHLFEMANIRDQCSWVHMQEPEKATEKAIDLVRAAVHKAARLTPIKRVTVGVVPTALVIGGGAAGLTAALATAEMGYQVELVEKSSRLGGMATKLRRGFYGEDVKTYINDLIKRVENHPRIHVHLEREVIAVRGYMGNFVSTLSDGSEIKHGATIIACGGEEVKPGDYLYGTSKQVMTQVELEEKLLNDPSFASSNKKYVFIQCVGSREPERPYCSRICCTKTINLALQLKELNPAAEIYVLYRDMRTYAFYEDKYREARQKGVIFIRYDVEKKPQVEENGGTLAVSIYDTVLREEFVLAADCLVLAAPIAPSVSNHALSQLYKVPLNADGFFLEAHMKLRPVDFPAEGIYMAGLAHGPKNLEESITQAKAAAGRAALILGREQLESRGVTAVVDLTKCASCLTCVRLCPFNAPRIVPPHHKAEIEAVLCQGCGTCAGECPNKAIRLQGYADEQQMAAVDGLFYEQQ